MGLSNNLIIKGDSKEEADQFWFKDSWGRKITISKIGTHVKLMVAYGSEWLANKNDDWQFAFHSGVIFSDNTFSVDGKDYKYCLVHTLADADTGCALIHIQAADTESELKGILKGWVTKFRVDEDHISFFQQILGESKVKISVALRDVLELTKKEFQIWQVKENIRRCASPLLPESATNCLHSALVICTALRTEKSPCAHEEWVIYVCFGCGELIMSKMVEFETKMQGVTYTDTTKCWAKLYGEMKVAFKYKSNVLSTTTEKGASLLEDIKKKKPGAASAA